MIESGRRRAVGAPEHRYAIESTITGNRRDLLERVPEGATVLDVGCWSGSIGRYLQRERNAVVDGIEPESAMAARAAEAYRTVFPAGIERVLPCLQQKHEGCYDAILLLDVLEHLTQPGTVLNNLRGLLRPGGVALISLPNVAHWRIRLALLRGRWRYRDNGILDRTHLRFFTAETAGELLEDSGWVASWCRASVQGLPINGWEQSRLWERWPELFAVQLLFEAVDGRSGR